MSRMKRRADGAVRRQEIAKELTGPPSVKIRDDSIYELGPDGGPPQPRRKIRWEDYAITSLIHPMKAREEEASR